MPFSTRLLIDFISFHTALLANWANIFLPEAMLYASWGRATRASLVKSDTPPEVVAAICRRTWIAQSFYAFGALLCVFKTYCSIAFIILVQLNYPVAPRLWCRKITWDADTGRRS